jgi:hypothetical protein
LSALCPKTTWNGINHGEMGKSRSAATSFLYHYISPRQLPPKPATSWS